MKRALTFQEILCFSFLGGVLLPSLFLAPFDYLPWRAAPFLFLFLFFLCVFSRFFHRSIIIFILIGFFFGLFRFFIAMPVDTPGHLGKFADKWITFTAEIVSEPQRFDLHSRYKVRPEQISFLNHNYDVTGDILLTTKRHPEYFYGDLIEVYGLLELPEHESKISYRTFLSKDKVFAVMGYPKYVRVLESGRGSRFWEMIIILKERFEHVVQRRFAEPGGSYLLGLLIGVRRNIPPEIVEAFRRTGLTHVLALSGFNITIVAGALALFMKSFPRKLKIFLCCLGISAFVVFVGASASVTRAGVMGVLGLIALGSGRPQHVLYLLLLAAVTMVLWNPFALFYDIGFQLSVAATSGLVIFVNRFEASFRRLLGRIEKFTPKFIIETISVTFAAQVFALPLVFIHFRSFSLISPLANLLVLPFVPLTMLFGFIAVVLDLVHFGLGLIPAVLTHFCLIFMLNVIQLLSQISWASADFL